MYHVFFVDGMNGLGFMSLVLASRYLYLCLYQVNLMLRSIATAFFEAGKFK
ncbi:hypothetical protein K435DRAFT_228270 [Dendrothele bispora CBS 962.96]|uniref:Uncharacterized protein n=1 Tax=Dendrothele bispora (strain CBS 962.96) TaxID=1314807 RepID=A0A4S8LQG8_DENBC|nr:hypothetical protein K435DRAFT_228270 [Dendrothele bispora CBS 962.96]